MVPILTGPSPCYQNHKVTLGLPTSTLGLVALVSPRILVPGHFTQEFYPEFAVSSHVPFLHAEVAPSLMCAPPTTHQFTMLHQISMSTLTVTPISSQVITTLSSISSTQTPVLAMAPVFPWASVITRLTILVPSKEG
jgi:hypothetical protein